MKRWAGFFIGSLFVTLFLVATFSLAQTSDEVARRKTALEAELKLVEQQIVQQTKLLQTTQQEKSSLQRDLSILTTQISRAKLIIKQHQQPPQSYPLYLKIKQNLTS